MQCLFSKEMWAFKKAIVGYSCGQFVAIIFNTQENTNQQHLLVSLEQSQQFYTDAQSVYLTT